MGCITTFDKPIGFKTKKFPLPDYGEGAYMLCRPISEKALRELTKKYGNPEVDNPDKPNTNHAIIRESVVDEQGKKCFATLEDVQELDIAFCTVVELTEFILKLSGIDTSEAKKKS